MLTKFFTGRINRKQYICYYAATVVAAFLVLLAVSLIASFTDPSTLAHVENGDLPSIVSIPTYIISIITLVLSFSFDIRRFHDLSRPTSWAVVPLVLGALNILPAFDEMNMGTYILSGAQIVIFLYLCFARGTQGENEYGQQP